MDKIKAYVWSKLIDGDNTLRINYDLNADSLVFDVGGFKGDFSDRIFNKFGCNIFIFEPVKEFYESICDRFKENEKIKVFNFAFGDENKKKRIVISGDSTNIFDKIDENSVKEEIIIKKISKFIKEEKIEKIDLIKMNVEGSEYSILNDIFKNNLQDKIMNLQIQFHDIEISEAIKNEIDEKLKLFYNLSFKFPYLWESWKNKNLENTINNNCDRFFDLITDLQSKIDELNNENSKLKSDLYNKTIDYNLIFARVGTMINNINHEFEKFKPELRKILKSIYGD